MQQATVGYSYQSFFRRLLYFENVSSIACCVLTVRCVHRIVRLPWDSEFVSNNCNFGASGDAPNAMVGRKLWRARVHARCITRHVTVRGQVLECDLVGVDKSQLGKASDTGDSKCLLGSEKKSNKRTTSNSRNGRNLSRVHSESGTINTITMVATFT